MPLDLTSNLISEAIGILFTVFFVDRVIIWRNNIKWFEVKSAFLIYAGRYSDLINEKWEKWLITLPEVTDNLIAKSRELLIKKHPTMQGVFVKVDEDSVRAGIKKEIEVLQLYWGNPIGSKFRQFVEQTRDVAIQKKVEKSLGVFLSHLENIKELETNLIALKNELEPLVDKLSNLIDRYPSIIDHRFSLPVIELSLVVVDLGFVPPAFNIGEGLKHTIELHNYIEKEFNKNLRGIFWR